ncbi:MAG: ribonucrease [Thermoleophilaceae bacterium]|jgi:ribonuclease Y|nr:ribonucrease [Thermoleophilaceae bacterium]MEA2399640.1 ribonucrease [Thermoleophilaceae bacterium]
MEIVLAALVAAAVAVSVALLLQRPRAAQPASGVPPGPDRADAPVGGGSASGRADELEDELRVRRDELARLEERLRAKEGSIELVSQELAERERGLDDRQRNVDHGREELKVSKRDQLRELERVAGLSAGQAKQIMMRELEDELRHESARLIRQIEEETRHDADRRARSILATVMQRLASSHAMETTVSVVELKSDELKGRIIGREGRNIRTLETLTGIDFIIDDTPGAVLLSGFDGVRREIARLTLEKLLQDGRIHPARIEEAFHQAKSDIDQHVVEVGEQAVFEANVGSVHPELVKLLGKLRFRTSYGQNVLAHSIECARLAGMLAAELGGDPRVAARAALLHDIGKAVSHETEGPHALVGGELARRYKETEAVAHAMEAHHNEVELQTVEAVIVQIVDSLSGARPGARGESLELYVKRLHELEAIAARHAGVDKVYAMHAGREIRVIVQPDEIDDDRAALLSHEIAREVEKELEYPGQIKVTVIRESRATDYAR